MIEENSTYLTRMICKIILGNLSKLSQNQYKALQLTIVSFISPFSFRHFLNHNNYKAKNQKKKRTFLKTIWDFFLNNVNFLSFEPKSFAKTFFIYLQQFFYIYKPPLFHLTIFFSYSERVWKIYKRLNIDASRRCLKNKKKYILFTYVSEDKVITGVIYNPIVLFL